MSTVRKTLYRWFLLIQEPRVVRLGMLAFYLYVIITGIQSFTSSPDRFFEATGPSIVFSIGVFFIIGGGLGAIAILPGLWYIERIALISLGFGFLGRAIVISALGVSDVGASILITEIILLFVRFVSIRRADLAPIAG